MLLGVSAGAIGTEANCDMVADTLHAINPGIKVMVLTRLVLSRALLSSLDPYIFLSTRNPVRVLQL